MSVIGIASPALSAQCKRNNQDCEHGHVIMFILHSKHACACDKHNYLSLCLFKIKRVSLTSCTTIDLGTVSDRKSRLLPG
jgi:hypothetical protein